MKEDMQSEMRDKAERGKTGMIAWPGEPSQGLQRTRLLEPKGFELQKKITCCISAAHSPGPGSQQVLQICL